MKPQKRLRQWRRYRHDRAIIDMAEMIRMAITGVTHPGVRTWTYTPSNDGPPFTLSWSQYT